MKYKGGTTFKKPRPIRVRISSVAVKCSQKRELSISAFKVFNKHIILVNKECMVLVCYSWVSQEFYWINF